MPVSGAGPGCSQIAASFGGSFPCNSYGHTVAVAAPIDIFDGDYRMEGFRWATDGCNAANGLLQTGGFPDSEDIDDASTGPASCSRACTNLSRTPPR